LYDEFESVLDTHLSLAVINAYMTGQRYRYDHQLSQPLAEQKQEPAA
jgi:hypothetical protein